MPASSQEREPCLNRGPPPEEDEIGWYHERHRPYRGEGVFVFAGRRADGQTGMRENPKDRERTPPGQTGKRADLQRPQFRQQVLWRKAQDFAAEIAKLTVELPADRATAVIGNQLLRAASSISANIAEGFGRYSQPAYRNHLSIARGSAFESESWLDLLHRRGYLTNAAFDTLLAACDELQSLLTLRMKSLADGRTYAVREEQVPYEI
jgi:four helix bundle protein